MEKETKQTTEVTKPNTQSKWQGIGLAAYIVAIIFCILECIGMLAILVYGIVLCTNPPTSQQGSDQVIVLGAILIVIALVYIIFGIIATTKICKRTKAGEHLNLALSICSILFFNIVVGIIATIYSTQVPVATK